MQIRNAVLAESATLPPLGDLMYQYIVAGNGLFIRAEDSHLEALVPVSPARCYGLVDVEPYARLKCERIPVRYLWAVLSSARRHLPNEAMYQFFGELCTNDEWEWRCGMPKQETTFAAIEFQDTGSIVDLHSHGALGAFFSTTDDGDEQGLRFYVVIGKVDTLAPEIAVRVGVYGHHMTVPVTAVFDGPGPFVEVDPDDITDNILSEDLKDETTEPTH